MQGCRLCGLRPPFAVYRKCVCLFPVLFIFSLDNKEKPHIYINVTGATKPKVMGVPFSEAVVNGAQ